MNKIIQEEPNAVLFPSLIIYSCTRGYIQQKRRSSSSPIIIIVVVVSASRRRVVLSSEPAPALTPSLPLPLPLALPPLGKSSSRVLVLV